ncbi:MAG: pentapeptide repeat-containing protein, partial [Phycisphaerales bacterium]|nr:pentapeptide repeat-containing protein [Phycisphaerales bacterium]
SFAGDARFYWASFAGDVGFYDASFAGDAWFYEASFAGDARFIGASFARGARFDRANFAGDVSGDLRRSYLRTAVFGEEAQRTQPREGMAKWLRRAVHWIMPWRWITRSFGWQKVRALGQLQILNRVSVFALIVVPVLAALTGALQAQFPEWPNLGTTPALVFFASVAVTLGLFVYQTQAAEDVRKYDEDEFVDRAHRRYPEDATDRDDGLRRAIEHLEVIAKRRLDRHRNFVKHHGDTIWIPPRDQINWFVDVEPVPVDETETDPEKRPEVSSSEIVPGAERRRITIEEGAKAEYWLKSRKSVFSAWVSFLLYLIGIGFLFVVLVIQGKRIVEAAGWIDAPPAVTEVDITGDSTDPAPVVRVGIEAAGRKPL